MSKEINFSVSKKESLQSRGDGIPKPYNLPYLDFNPIQCII